MAMRIVAGAAVAEELRIAKEQQVPKSSIPGREQYYDSEALCKFQSQQALLGYLGAEVTQSIYGWTVRYDSGLHNFGLIAGVRRGDLGGSLEEAVQFAIDWVAKDPSKRYAWIYERS